jgi:hypothetical protein
LDIISTNLEFITTSFTLLQTLQASKALPLNIIVFTNIASVGILLKSLLVGLANTFPELSKHKKLDVYSL